MPSVLLSPLAQAACEGSDADLQYKSALCWQLKARQAVCAAGEVMGREAWLSELTNARGCAEFPVFESRRSAPACYRDKCLFKM